jgi:PAS domain S-box-containing protein
MGRRTTHLNETEKLRIALAERDRLLSEANLRAARAETILAIRDTLLSSEYLELGIERALEICCKATGADAAFLLESEGATLLVTRLANNRQFGLPQWNLPGNTFARPYRITAIEQTPIQPGVPRELEDFKSLLSVPLQGDGASTLALALMSKSRAKFTSQNMELMQAVATMVGRFIERRRLQLRADVLAQVIEDSTPNTDEPEFLDRSVSALGRTFARLSDWNRKIIAINNDLLSARTEAHDDAINLALARTGEMVGSDRTYVFRIRPPDRLDNTHEWVAPGIPAMITELQDLPIDILDEWAPTLTTGQAVEIPAVSNLPEDSAVRNVLEMQGILSLLVVPMQRDGKLTGFVGYDSVKAHRPFLPIEVALLQSITNAIAIVMDRSAAEAAELAARERLLRERDRLKATMAAIPDLVLEVDKEGRFIGYNAGAEAGPALPDSMVIGKLMEEVLPPELASLARKMMGEIDANGRCPPHTYEMQIGDVSGWYSASIGAPQLSETTRSYVFVVRNISEIRRAERKLRRLSRVAELTSNLVVVTDHEGRIEWVNPAFEARSGWTLAEVMGRKPGDFLQSEDTDSYVVREIGDALRSHASVRAEILNRSKSGESYWVTKDIKPLFDDLGELEGFISVQTDITALRVSHQQELNILMLAMEVASDGIAITDAQGAFRFMNTRYKRVLGISPKEDIAKIQWHEVIPSSATKTLKSEAWPEVSASGTWRGGLTWSHPNSQNIETDVTLTRTDTGHTLWIARDMAAQRAAEIEKMRLIDELQMAQRRETLAHIASGVAHDLNNLVAVVSGTVNMLKDTSASDEPTLSGLNRIGRAMDAAHDLVAGLGHLGKPPITRQSLNLRSLILNVVDLLGTTRVKQHGLEIEFDETDFMVHANRTDFLQVLLNLALNACEAVPDRHARVTIRTHRADQLPKTTPNVGRVQPGHGYCLFSVTDDGNGVDPSVRDSLFDRYVTTKGKSGTGLGLPIIAGILRDNDAALWFDSTTGVGTTVTVAWPTSLYESNIKLAPFNVLSHGSASLDGKYILVVDDIADVADVISEMLESDGAIALAVSDPHEAVNLLQENPGLWAALVTDLDMPKVNGAELALAAARVSPPVPSILVTALPDSGGWDHGLFYKILAKPTDKATLIRTMRAAVATNRHTDA